MSQNPQDLALAIVRKLQLAGHTAYFAGGCVRDRLMNRTPKDFDVATSALPDQVLALFPRSQLVGAAFGVIIIREKKIQIEVATFRSEGVYSDGRHPDSVSFTTPEIDARRRDFTCNALFYDPVADQLRDFVNGRADIDAKLLRAVGDPAHRFAEDHLRMMRAVRFAAKLDFQIEKSTYDAIRTHVVEIQKISHERIGEELRMMLEHSSRATAVKLLADTSLLWKIWPDISKRAPGAWNTLASLDGLVSRALGLAAMHVDIWNESVPRPWGKREWTTTAGVLQITFVLSNTEKDEIEWIGEIAENLLDSRVLTRAAFKRLMADPRWSTALKLFDAWSRNPSAITALRQRESQMLAEGGPPPPFITGDDLIKLGATPGKKFKHWLDSLYDRQLELEFPTRDAALAAARVLLAQS